MADFFFADEPQPSAGGVFDPMASAPPQEKLKESDPFFQSGEPLSFPVGSAPLDGFEAGPIKTDVDEELGEDELARIRAAEQAYQALMQRLYEKETAEQDLKSERQAQARDQLTKWRNEKQRQTDQRKGLNREQEIAFLEARKTYKAGNPWKNVCSMIDFKEKSDGKDVTRMRTVLLSKKNEG